MIEERFNELDFSSLDSIHKVELDLTHLEVYTYIDALGRILFGSKSNRNDWNYYEFVMASKEDKIKALKKVLNDET